MGWGWERGQGPLESQSGSSPLQASQTLTATTCPAFGASLPSSGPSCSASTPTATGLTLPTSASSAISDAGGEISAPWGPQDLDSAAETSGGTVPPLGYPSTVAENTRQEDFGLPRRCPVPFGGNLGVVERGPALLLLISLARGKLQIDLFS